MSGSIPLLKKGAHLALSANEEVRMGASGSADEGTRLESEESLERTFEGPGCGGRAAPLSLASDLQRFRCSSVRLPSGLRGDTTGVSLRFSRCHELFIIIHDRGKRTSPLLCWGLLGAKTVTSGCRLLVSSRLEAWAGEGKGAFGSKS
jgi:hypothetical protein